MSGKLISSMVLALAAAVAVSAQEAGAQGP